CCCCCCCLHTVGGLVGAWVATARSRPDDAAAKAMWVGSTFWGLAAVLMGVALIACFGAVQGIDRLPVGLILFVLIGAPAALLVAWGLTFLAALSLGVGRDVVWRSLRILAGLLIGGLSGACVMFLPFYPAVGLGAFVLFVVMLLVIKFIGPGPRE